MSSEGALFYKRATFVAHLPQAHLYSPSHLWAGALGDGWWRVGYTKFATRMLGEIVDFQFDKKPGDAVGVGEIIGAVEGFKALSDVYSIVEGEFGGENDALRQEITLLGEDPFDRGWLFRIRGAPDPRCMDVHKYRELLDTTIDRLLAKQGAE